jgi:hypothetical protein
MSEIAPLDAGFESQYLWFRSSFRRAADDGDHFFAPLVGFAIVIAIASAVSVAGAAVSHFIVFGSRIEGPPIG